MSHACRHHHRSRLSMFVVALVDRKNPSERAESIKQIAANIMLFIGSIGGNTGTGGAAPKKEDDDSIPAASADANSI